MTEGEDRDENRIESVNRINAATTSFVKLQTGVYNTVKGSYMA